MHKHTTIIYSKKCSPTEYISEESYVYLCKYNFLG